MIEIFCTISIKRNFHFFLLVSLQITILATLNNKKDGKEDKDHKNTVALFVVLNS